MPDEPMTPASDPAPTGDPAPVGDPTPAADPAPVGDPGQVQTPAPTGDPAPSVGDPAPASEPLNFHSYINEDGSLKEGWRVLLPEELQGEESLEFVNDFPGAMKQLVNAQHMIGKDKIAVPGPNATPEELDAFQVALGRPKTMDEYKVELPEGFDNTMFDEQATKELAFKLGFSQETLDKVLQIRAIEEQELAAEREAVEEQAVKEGEMIIRAIAGEALEDQKHYANRLIEDNLPKEAITLPDGRTINPQQYKEKLLEGINSSSVRPYIFNFLANIQRATFGEHGGPPAGGDQPTAMTPAMLKAEADRLMNTEGYLNGALKDSNPEQYKLLTNQIKGIYDRIERASKQTA